MQVVVEFPGAQMYRSMCSPLFTPGHGIVLPFRAESEVFNPHFPL